MSHDPGDSRPDNGYDSPAASRIKSVRTLAVAAVVCGGVLFGCTPGQRAADLAKEPNYEWVAVSTHGEWETSKLVDTLRPNIANAWRAIHRIEQRGYYSYTCRTATSPPEGKHGISEEIVAWFRFLGIGVGRDKRIGIATWSTAFPLT